jgi:peptidoglycan hydrolase-like protein with peptidoglycan-binding domain/TPR repeat protein
VSRSLWAWTKSCAVGGTRRVVARISRSQVEAHLGVECSVRTVSSLTPLIWAVAASMVMLTVTPVALGKVGTPNTGSSAAEATPGGPTLYAALAHKSRSPIRSSAGARSAGGERTATEALAFGSGYRTPHGSQAVKALQRRLATLGYQPGPLDGRYGPRTEAAVVRFQATHRLTVDGVAGVRTRAALATAQPVLYPGEGNGPHGSGQVRSLQRHLARAGFSPGPIDGRYGALTARAVKRFQAARHLRVDGIAGPQTLGRLLRPVRHGHHEVRPRRSAAPRRTHPAPVQPAGRPRPANRGPASTRRPRGSSAGAFPVVWVIVVVLAGLMLAFLARQRWHRRGDRTEVPENTAVPVPVPDMAVPVSDVSVPVSDGAGGLAAPPTEDQDAHQQDGGAAFRLGLLLARAGDRVGAEDAFRRADERGHAGAAFELGFLLAEEGDDAGATEAMRRADERGHPGGAFNLGVLLAAEGDLAGAKRAFRRAAERGHPDAAFNLGALLLQDGDLAGAEEAFRQADQHGDGRAACNLGVLLEERGDVLGAMEAYRRADERGQGVGACNLGSLLEQQGDLAAAKAAYQRADQRGDSTGAYHLGMLLEREGDLAAAKDAYRRADQRGHPEGACQLGLLLQGEGDQEGAAGAFRRAGERGSPEAAKVARAALLELDPAQKGEAC